MIYEIYDALAEKYPAFVTKKVLGSAFDWYINSYSFRAPLPENTSGFEIPQFKICIVTSIHGYEQGCAWTAAHFFRLLMENSDDPDLAFLRRNVVFEVIPVANPSGFSRNQRGNDNGVDLNRNFEKDFVYDMDKTSKYYGGEGMFADFLREENLWALTLETPWCMPVIGKAQYDAPTIRCAVDVLANTILATVRSYK